MFECVMCITGNHLSLCFKLSLLNKLICQVWICLNEMDFLLIGSNGNDYYHRFCHSQKHPSKDCSLCPETVHFSTLDRPLSTGPSTFGWASTFESVYFPHFGPTTLTPTLRIIYRINLFINNSNHIKTSGVTFSWDGWSTSQLTNG